MSLVLYDVTMLYFEAENQDALRRVGYDETAALGRVVHLPEASSR